MGNYSFSRTRQLNPNPPCPHNLIKFCPARSFPLRGQNHTTLLLRSLPDLFPLFFLHALFTHGNAVLFSIHTRFSVWIPGYSVILFTRYRYHHSSQWDLIRLCSIFAAATACCSRRKHVSRRVSETIHCSSTLIIDNTGLFTALPL